MSITLPQLTDEELILARDLFTARSAAMDLSEARGEARASLQEITDGTASGPIPIKLLRLRRHMARAGALGVSTAARAASTGTATERIVGPFRLEIAEEGALTYLVVQVPDGETAPTRIELFGGNGDTHGYRALPDPISGYIQLGLDPSKPDESDFLQLLGDPATEVILR